MVQRYYIHRDALPRCMILANYLMGTGPQKNISKDIDTEVFGLLIRWLNGQVTGHRGPEDLLLANKKPHYQHRLMHLWVLAGRVGLSKLQNDAINMLETRIRFDGNRIQTEDFGFVVENTKVGDALRRYIINTCVSTGFDDDEYGFFPEVLRQDIKRARLIKGDGARVGDIHEYHVVVENGGRAIAKGKRRERET
jgi:hypothetical protein